ncbi:DUF1963 domain-containing protein [Armatimonas sp.]|uniref:DUF1963 domain-containing protein n=1 Tax=Armatimonas sp. TaxID=1872638 RepID=UPI00374CDC11
MAQVTKEMLRERFFQAGLESFWPQIERVLRPAIAVKSSLCSDALLSVGASKRGGAPDLPVDFVWPEREGKPCAFYCQINLAQATRFDVEELLPKRGLLSFFTPEESGLGVLDGEPVYFLPDVTLARRGECELAEHISFAYTWSMPDYQSSGKLDFLGDKTEAALAFEQVSDVLFGWMGEGAWTANADLLHACAETCDHLLGHADDYQGDHEPQCELVYQGIVQSFYQNRPDNYMSLCHSVEQQAYDDWVCLLKKTTSAKLP